MIAREIRHFHLFAGLGGGARGFNQGEARVGNLEAKFRCIGGIDVDAAAIADFGRLAGIPGTVLDLFSRQQYEAFHGHPPPADWREATIADIHRAAHHERPHIVFLSAPCKGFSGLLSEARSKTGKYQALNELTLRGVFLMLEAWADDPPELIIFENVPRIANRGRHLLDQIVQLLQAHGYAVAETTHDCGEIGGLAQSRKRFLLVARHREKVPPFLYEPEKHRLRAVGDVLGKLPMPGHVSAGPMHRMPRLQWQTWVRLAFVEPGKDWRSLQDLKVEDGFLTDFGIVPDWGMHNGVLGVTPWNMPMGTVQGNSLPTNGRFAVASPLPTMTGEYSQLGVREWGKPMGAVSGQSTVGGGSYAVEDPRIDGVRHNSAFKIVRWAAPSPAVMGPGGAGANVADPRVGYSEGSHRNKLSVINWEKPARTVTGGSQVQGGALSVADPRGYGEHTHHHVLKVTPWDESMGTVTASRSPGGGAGCVADPRRGDDGGKGKYRVTAYDAPAGTVIAASTTGQGAFAVADPMPGMNRQKGDDYLTGGHYGVIPWHATAYTVSGHARHDNGWNNVGDPREFAHPCKHGRTGWCPACLGERDVALPAAAERLVCVIRALDGTWHRPFTTLELAALQSLVDPEEHLELTGLSDSAWRERIGNAVPSKAAKAIAGVMGRTLLLAWAGETFLLSNEPIWVRDVALALAVDMPVTP